MKNLNAHQDARAITEFVSRTFFRHYLLYKFCFTKKTEMAFSSIYTYTLSVADDPTQLSPCLPEVCVCVKRGLL